MHDEIPVAGIIEKIRLMLGRLDGITIEGDSMFPTLKAGDRVLIDKKAAIGVDDVVVAHHPFKSSVKIVKRISAIESEGEISLAGDNPSESSDSRVLGPFRHKDVIGKVVSRLN